MFSLTLLNVLLSWLPRPCIAAMAATAIRAAIRPYSIAVAPLEFFRKLRIFFIPVSIVPEIASFTDRPGKLSRTLPLTLRPGSKETPKPRRYDAVMDLRSMRRLDLVADVFPHRSGGVRHVREGSHHGDHDHREDDPIFDCGRAAPIADQRADKMGRGSHRSLISSKTRTSY